MFICNWPFLNHMDMAEASENNPSFDRKIENATYGLEPGYKQILQRISKKNASIIDEYCEPSSIFCLFSSCNNM